jgi:hypothetical protein
MMARSIKVFPLGTQVVFGTENYYAEIVQIAIRRGCEPTYEVQRWQGAELKTLWLHPDDFEVVDETQQRKVGFCNVGSK